MSSFTYLATSDEVIHDKPLYIEQNACCWQDLTRGGFTPFVVDPSPRINCHDVCPYPDTELTVAHKHFEFTNEREKWIALKEAGKVVKQNNSNCKIVYWSYVYEETDQHPHPVTLLCKLQENKMNGATITQSLRFIAIDTADLPKFIGYDLEFVEKHHAIKRDPAPKHKHDAWQLRYYQVNLIRDGTKTSVQKLLFPAELPGSMIHMNMNMCDFRRANLAIIRYEHFSQSKSWPPIRHFYIKHKKIHLHETRVTPAPLHQQVDVKTYEELKPALVEFFKFNKHLLMKEASV